MSRHTLGSPTFGGGREPNPGSTRREQEAGDGGRPKPAGGRTVVVVRGGLFPPAGEQLSDVLELRPLAERLELASPVPGRPAAEHGLDPHHAHHHLQKRNAPTL